MTVTMNGPGLITLSRDEVAEVQAVVGVVEDWLLGCAEFVLADLESFLPLGYGPPSDGPRRVRRFIDELGDTGVLLARLLWQPASTTSGGAS